MAGSKPHIAVIGAGSFGGWTALHLLERGARVTLIDAWGPGNSRSSSGGETRIMRGTYGPDQPYTGLAARSLKLWQKYQRRWERTVLHRTGVLWMSKGDDEVFERGSIDMLKQARMKFEELSVAKMKKRWPQIDFAGVRWGIFEPECGYLEARATGQAVFESFIAQGGEYRQAEVSPNGLETSPLRSLQLSDKSLSGKSRSGKSKVKADIYVFACGPWLGKLFPQTIGNLIRPTKQDVFFFGTPAGDARFTDSHLPVWADHRDRFLYGIPGNDHRGFKVADDPRGPVFDPTSGERIVSEETLRTVREYVAFRFPALKNPPLIESRVCQYEQTADGNFVLDRHPRLENVWLLGGGSGHGFKHGPAVGEMMAECILRGYESDARWRLSRFPTKE